VYLPANSLSNTLTPHGVGMDIGIGIFWGITLNLLAFSLWNHSMKKYEAIGI